MNPNLTFIENGLKIGVINKTHMREYTSEKSRYEVEQYQGQIILHDGEQTWLLDDSEAEILQKKGIEAEKVFSSVFNERKQQMIDGIERSKSLNMDTTIYTETIYWSQSIKEEDIDFCESTQEALGLYKPMPLRKRVLARCSPLKVK